MTSKQKAALELLWRNILFCDFHGHPENLIKSFSFFKGLLVRGQRFQDPSDVRDFLQSLGAREEIAEELMYVYESAEAECCGEDYYAGEGADEFFAPYLERVSAGGSQ